MIDETVKKLDVGPSNKLAWEKSNSLSIHGLVYLNIKISISGITCDLFTFLHTHLLTDIHSQL